MTMLPSLDDPRRQLPKLPSETPLLDRVLLRATENESGCWVFAGALDVNGYGVVNMRGRIYRTHVVTWEATNGPVPTGLHVDHLCRVRSCCNPAHLEPVTPHVNTWERGRHSTNGLPVSEFCKRGHPRTPENSYQRPDGQGVNCLPCIRLRSALAYEYHVPKKWSGPIPDRVHGTTNGYGNYGCRCKPCRAAKAASRR